MIPPVVFVLGKGGVGRSTVATALAAGFAERGERALVAQWAMADAISPWFEGAPAGWEPRPIARGLDTMNFSVEPALHAYFVEHLGRRAFYRAVVANRHVRRLTRAAPGLEELMFLGTLTWLATLAGDERGWRYDHVVVDAPAMGHGASLFAVPRAAARLGLGGLLAQECAGVAAMLAEPRRSAALVVATPDELAVEETREFWPRIASDLGRPPLALIVNRSARRLGPLPADARDCDWLDGLAPDAGPDERAGLERVYEHLARRGRRERALVEPLAREAPLGAVPVNDVLLVDDAPLPRQVVARATEALSPLWSAP